MSLLSYRLSSNPRTLSPSPTNFTSTHSPQTRCQILTALLQACTPNELLFLFQTIAPLLKRDFLFSLPPGLTRVGVHRRPIRASLVSKWMVSVEEDMFGL